MKAESDEGTNHIIKKGKHGNQISAINSLEMNYSWQISPKTASETCSTGTHTPQNKIADLQTEKDGQQSFFIFPPDDQDTNCSSASSSARNSLRPDELPQIRSQEE